MTAAAWRDRLGWLLPLLSGLLAVLAVVLPGGLALAPLLSLAVIVQWSLLAPAFLPYGSVFLVGLALDILTGLPPGLNALTFLLAAAAARSARPYLLPHGFVLSWAAFAALALAASLLRWLLATLLWGHLFPLRPCLAEAALTAACYPAVAWLLAGPGRLLTPDPHAAGG